MGFTPSIFNKAPHFEQLTLRPSSNFVFFPHMHVILTFIATTPESVLQNFVLLCALWLSIRLRTAIRRDK